MQDKANLARVRDNQRRSRARRKEYLQDLEDKYRNCELLGAEAASEIQTAARRVAEENKRLRALLRARGVSDDEIDGHLEKSFGEPVVSTARSLDAMLSTRKPCGGRKPGASCQPSESSPMRLETFNVAGAQSYVPQPQPTPPMSFPILEHSHTQPGSSVGSYPSSNTSELESHFHMNNATDWTTVGQFDFSGVSTDADTSSCNFAATLLTSMRGDISADQVKMELGCAPGSDCKIANATLFNAMDRYSEQPLG
ncbi:hypothetical protein MMC24_006926 [Lignoscripta atroalba]|nr:hypothetical protein [Lignoscripta atroalba]